MQNPPRPSLDLTRESYALAQTLSEAIEQLDTMIAIAGGRARLIEADEHAWQREGVICGALARGAVARAWNAWVIVKQDGQKRLTLAADERELILTELEHLRKVRNVNEHGTGRSYYETDGGGLADETGMVMRGERCSLGPVDLNTLLVTLRAIWTFASWSAARERHAKASIPLSS